MGLRNKVSFSSKIEIIVVKYAAVFESYVQIFQKMREQNFTTIF